MVTLKNVFSIIDEIMTKETKFKYIQLYIKIIIYRNIT